MRKFLILIFTGFFLFSILSPGVIAPAIAGDDRGNEKKENDFKIDKDKFREEFKEEAFEEAFEFDEFFEEPEFGNFFFNPFFEVRPRFDQFDFDR